MRIHQGFLCILGTVLALAGGRSAAAALESDADGHTLPARRMRRLREADDRIRPLCLDRRLPAASAGADPVAGADFLAIYDFFPVDGGASFTVRSDETRLRIFARCPDPAAAGAAGDRLWIQVSPGLDDPRFAQIQVDASGAASALGRPDMPLKTFGVVRRMLNMGERLRPAVSARVSREEFGWRAELDIPYAELGVAPPRAGDIWRVNVWRDRAGIEPISSWFPLLRGYHRVGSQPYWGVMGNQAHVENRYGEIAFGSKDQPLITRGITLRYETANALILELAEAQPAPGAESRWTWRGPDGRSGPLAAAPAPGTANRTWRIEPPFPGRPGRYQIEARAADDQCLLAVSFDRESYVRAGAFTRSANADAANQEKRAAHLNDISPAARALLEMLPPCNGFFTVASPADPEARRAGDSLRWSPDDPNRLVCAATGTVFPDDERYPESGRDVFRNQRGALVEFPYIRGQDGSKCHVLPRLWRYQLDHIVESLPALAESDPAGAARALYALARRYADFVPLFDQGWAPVSVLEPIGPPQRQGAGGVWAAWPEHSELERVVKLARALQTLRKTDVLDRLSAQVGEDAAARIEYGMLRSSAEYMRAFPIQNHNIDGFGFAHWIELGAILGEPDYAEDVIERVENLVADEFFVDGFFNEVTLDYHRQTLRRSVSSVSRLFTQYRPSIETSSPRLGRRLAADYDLEADLRARHAHLERAYRLEREIVYPNGRALPLQDTWASTTLRPRTAVEPRLFPGSRLARLERRGAAGPAQAWLLFPPKHSGHTHAVALNLALFDHGRELVPLLGYDRSPIRSWSQSALAQNTVVVNARDARDEDVEAGGDVRLFAPVAADWQVVRAAQHNVLPGVARQYEREVWMVGRPDGNAYYVDFFRVAGGERHEYTLNGEALHDASFSANLPMKPYNDYLLPPGTPVRAPAGVYERGEADGHYHAYLFVRDVSSAPIPDERFTLTLEARKTALRDGTFVAAGEELPGYRLTVFTGGGPAGSTLFLGRAPSLRPLRWARDLPRSENDVWAHWMPKFVARREGADLTSRFVGVIEPFEAQAPAVVTQIERHEEPGLLALRLRYGDTEDILLSAESADVEHHAFGARFQGLAGIVRRQDGEPVWLAAVGGVRLAAAGRQLAGRGEATGDILATMRIEAGDPDNAVLVAAAPDEAWPGATLVVEYPDQTTQGFAVADARPGPQAGTALVVLAHDPGFSVSPGGRVEQHFFPLKHWAAGPARFRLAPHAEWRAPAPSKSPQ